MRTWIAIAVILFVLCSCEDVIVKDISGEVVELIAPTDSLNTNVKKFTFWWNGVDGASEYELLIVSPDLDQPVQLELDTVITRDRFLFELPATGKYEWCVRAANSGYVTDYSCRILVIE